MTGYSIIVDGNGEKFSEQFNVQKINKNKAWWVQGDIDKVWFEGPC